MFELDKNFSDNLKINYLSLLTQYDYQAEFNKYFDEKGIIDLVSLKTSSDILKRVKTIITYRKRMLEDAKRSKEGMRK